MSSKIYLYFVSVFADCGGSTVYFYRLIVEMAGIVMQTILLVPTNGAFVSVVEHHTWS